MPDFNAVDYFARQAATAPVDTQTSTDKLQAVERASAQKYQELDDRVSLLKQRQVANASSWVGKLGLNPDGVAGTAVNTVAHLASGVMHMDGDIAAYLSADLPAIFSEAGLTDTQKAAVSRYYQGTATNEDKFLINHRPEGAPDGFHTPLEQVQQAAAYRQKGQDIRDSINTASEAVHNADTDALSDQLKAGFQNPWNQTAQGWDALTKKHEAAGTADLVSGVAKLVYNAGKAAVDHPMGAAGYMAENAPQLVAGAAGKTGEAAMMLSNIGYASDYYQQGMQNYREQHNGALPDDATQAKMAAQASSLALAEHAGNLFELKHAMGAAHAVEETGKTGLIQSLANTAKAALHGGAEETATEGYQGYMEGQVSQKPASAADVYENAVIGGLVGGGLSGGGRAIGEVTKSTPEHAAEREVQNTRNEAQAAAIQTGDVSALTNPKVATYDPANAVAALHANSLQQDVTEEAQQANLEKAHKVVSDLEERHVGLQTQLEQTTPEAIQGLKDSLQEAKTSGDTAQVKDLKEAVDTLSGVDRKALQRQSDKLKEHLDQAHENMARFHEDMGSVSDVQATVDAVSAPVDESDKEATVARSQAASSLINLSMASPDRLDTKTATSLAEDTKNGLTDSQRDYLRKFSEARVAENALKDTDGVSQEVYAGGNGNVGIAQYRARIGAALAAGNQQVAQQQLGKLANFQQDHQAKAAMVAQANAEFQKTGRGVQVVRNQDTNAWEINRGPTLSRKEMKANGGVTVYDRTPASLIAAFQPEADAISKSHDELAAAYALKFSNPKVDAHVQDVSQPHDQAQDQPAGNAPVQAQGSAAEATARPGSGSGVQGAGERPGVPSGRVAQSNESSAVDSVESQASPDAGAAGRNEGQLQSNNSTTEDQLNSTQQGGTTTSPESAEQTSAQSHETSEKQDGQLAAMSRKSPEGATATTRNLIADFFSQSASREGDKTQRPLVAVKDFLSTAFERAAEFAGFDELNDAQHRALADFKLVAQGWASKIKANLALKSSPAFNYEDLVQFLIENTDSGLDLEENVKTAIAYAAYAFVVETATKPAVNSNEEINAILGRDENDIPSEEDKDAVGHIGVRMNVVVNGLGQKVAQALGISATSQAYQDLAPRLHSALGARVMALLVQEGIVKVSSLTGVEMAILRGDPIPDDAKKYKALESQPHRFLKLDRDLDFKLSPKAQSIFEATRGSGSVLDKLFGVESGLKDPVFDLKEIAPQRSIRNTRQTVPSKQATIIEHENKQPNHLRQDMWHLVEGMADKFILQIAGWVEPSVETMHKANRLAQQAKNDGLERELGNLKDFVNGTWNDNGHDKPIFFEHTVWKQQRVGIANNTVNPQTSKIHRHLLTRPTWSTTIDPLDGEQLNNFKLRVLEGLGVKTDKQDNVKSLGEWDGQVTSNPKVQAAVAAIKERMAGGDLSEDQQSAIAAAASSMHALDSLVALAQMDGAKPFTTQLMGEVDGVTNGPMLTHMSLGAANSVEDLFERVNKGGFFQVGSDQENYNVWRGQPGNSDLYETTASNMTQTVQSLLSEMPKLAPVLQAIYGFTGELVDKNGKVAKAGRNIVKTPLTAMVFGSAVSKATNSMAMKFVEGIYGSIEDAAADERNGKPSKVSTIVANINLLLQAGGGYPIAAKTVSELMEHEFSPSEVKALVKAFDKTLGQAMKATMESDFENFIGKRKTFNHAAQLAFDLHNAVYTALRDQFVEELRAKGELPTRTTQKGAAVVLHDLTTAQEAELRKRLAHVAPVLNTQFSSESGSLASGLSISKGGRKLSQNDAYGQTVKFGQKVAGDMSVSTHAYEQRETNPGVAMLPMSIHSLDSYISHTAAMLGQVLNIHDAHGAGVGTFEKTARNLNQATWNALLAYSPASEMADALSRTVAGLAEVLAQKDLPPAVTTNLKSALETMARKVDPEAEHITGDNVVLHLMEQARQLAFQADDMKLEAQSKMASVDQYALEGGQYHVTEEDRAAAASKRQGLTKGLTEQENQAIDAISSALASGPAASTAIEEQISEDVEDGPAAPQPFGPVGTPQVKSDDALVAFFQANPDATARQVIQLLYAQIGSAPGRTNEFNAKLLKVLNKTVSADMPVRLVTPQTEEGDVLAKPDGAAHAWFVAKGDKSAIYLLSPEFANSGLTNETVLHELVHGALAQVVARELEAKKANPAYKSEALDLVNELEALRTEAAAYAKKQGITGFDAALADVQEFISWGMTNQKFQRQVISQVSLASKTGGTGLVNGMKKFISTLTGLLFKGSAKTEQEQAVNGMTTLISNVSGLFNRANQEQTASKPSVVLSMSSNPVGVLNTYSTLDIHDALNAGAVTPEFDSKLRDLLGGIVEKLHGTFGSLKQSLMANQALTPFDVWQKALATGVAPFASSLNAAPMTISERERHAMEQVEVTVREAISHNETTTRQAYRELRRLYEEMRETVKPSDFKSQAEYDFVFSVSPDAEGRSEHLARFAAFGLANQQFNQMLEGIRTAANRKVRDGRSFGERFQIMWEQILEFFHGDLANSYGGQQASSKLSELVGKLVDVEARKRTMLATQGNTMSRFDQTANKVSTAGRKAVNDLLGSEFIRNHKSPFVRAAGAVGRITANQQVMQVMDVLADFRNKHFDGTYGVMAGYLNELRGPGEILNTLQLAATNQQRERQTRIDQTSSYLRDAFLNGAEMAKETSDAITKVLLRTGMHTLIADGRFNMTELENLLGDKNAQAAAISTLESQLVGSAALKNHYILHANDLAYFTVTGKARRPVLMSNAYNIARVRDKLGHHVTEADAKISEKVIEQLIPLYAMGMLKEADVNAVKDTLRTENTRTDRPNAAEFLMKLHQRLEEESRTKLFENQEALMGHGYVPEILNPHTEVQTADDVEGEQLRYAGYSAEGKVALDPADPNQDPHRLYVLRDGGLQQKISGSMSYRGKNAKGTKVTSGFMNVNFADGANNASTHADIMASKMNSKLDSGPRPDLSKAPAKQQTYMVPIVNPEGEIVNWRYMMNAETKDNILERNNSFADVMGALAGSIYDKETTPDLNARVVSTLKEIYQAELGTNAASFLRVGPSSTDPQLAEIWRTLPDETRAEIRKVWGRDGMYVRKDQVNTVFGYRKFSLSETFKKDPGMREGLEKVFAWSVEHMLTVVGSILAKTPNVTPQQKDEFQNYAKRAAIMVTRGERIWQGIVRETKDIIVVKSITVMLGNIKGNFALLAAQGVKPTDILSGHLVAMRAARDYQSHSDEMAELQAQLDTKVIKGSTATAEAERRIIVLRDSIARNPIKKLIDLGLMPTIAEDQNKDDPYAYQNYFTKKFDEAKDKAISVLNPKVVSTVKNIYMAKDTAVYQGLSRITQLSDFAARYVLFKHLTERAEDPMSEKDATFEASEAFVNYDIPMHKGLQYMDDMGFLMFIKYFMRMQRVLIRTTKANPGRVLTSVALHHYMASIPSVLESSWMTRVGRNPFTWGALQFPSSLLDLGSVSSAMRLLK